MATIFELKTLKKGDYLKISGLYYKVFSAIEKGLYLSQPFSWGSKPRESKWFNPFRPDDTGYYLLWEIIRANSPEAKGIGGPK